MRMTSCFPARFRSRPGGDASDPAAAFNTVDHTWLVVWREALPEFGNAAEIRGRIVLEKPHGRGGRSSSSTAARHLAAARRSRSPAQRMDGGDRSGPMFDAGLFPDPEREKSQPTGR
jgi:hypothetical protein